MNRPWVVNASPLIALAKIGRLDLLLTGGRTVIVPEAVVCEILDGPGDDPARQALSAGWGPLRAQVVPAPDILEWGLGAGETAVLTLAREKALTAVVDDRSARRAASALGVRVLGTLGVVLRARLNGHIPSSVEILLELKRAGLRLGGDILREALRETTGETWPETFEGA
jgi:predicted nucleic acid-binding protein